MPFQTDRKLRNSTPAWIAYVFIGLGSLASVAAGQEKCDDSIVHEAEPAASISGEWHFDESENFFAPKKTDPYSEELADNKIESLNEDASTKTDQPQNSTEVSAGNLGQEPISQIGLSLSPQLPTPELKLPPDTPQNFLVTAKNYQWTAPNDYYQNLLFEEPLLERHGVSKKPKLQPIISGVKFFKSSILLPLDIAKGHHKRCDNPLGWGVPGDHCR